MKLCFFVSPPGCVFSVIPARNHNSYIYKTDVKVSLADWIEFIIIIVSSKKSLNISKEEIATD